MFNAVNKLWLSAACMKNMELDSHSTKKLPVWKKIWVGAAAWKHVKLTSLHLQKLLPPHVTNTVAAGKKMDTRQGREVGPEVHLHRKKTEACQGHSRVFRYGRDQELKLTHQRTKVPGPVVEHSDIGLSVDWSWIWSQWPSWQEIPHVSCPGPDLRPLGRQIGSCEQSTERGMRTPTFHSEKCSLPHFMMGN